MRNLRGVDQQVQTVPPHFLPLRLPRAHQQNGGGCDDFAFQVMYAVDGFVVFFRDEHASE